MVSALVLLCACESGKTVDLGSAVAPATNPELALAFQSNRSFGKGLSPVARNILTKTERQALEFGQQGEPMYWKTSKASGLVKVQSPFRIGRASCRRFEHVVNIDDQESKVDGTACKRSSAGWHLVQ